jgi:hypothetical protein
VFDHFVRVLTRPQAGRHYANLPGRGELWSAADGLIGADVNPLFNPSLVIPNGTARAGQSLTFGGRPLTNAFQYGRGYFYYEYVDRAGSFYEKTWATEPLLSAFYRAPHVFSQLDGIDGRWRHTNFTNLYPDGMRRLLGIALTQDWALLGPRVSADANGRPEVEPDASGAPFPKRPLGWVSFTDPRGPRVCWPESDVYTCTDPSGAEVVPAAGPSRSVVIDPQLGYEVQKFIALWAWVYLPTSQDSDYADSMRIYKAGRETNPYLPSESVEWRDPESGLRYVARRYGSETLLGKTYDRGIAAKMIQWANQLTARAYELDEAAPFDPVTGAVNPRLDSSGRPVVRRDPSLTPQGEGELTCADNRACGDLRGYRGLLDFMHALASDLDFPGPNLDGD